MVENNCSMALAGIARDCQSNNGGIRKIYFANRKDVENIEVQSDKVSAITMAMSGKFKEYNLPTGTANYATTFTGDPANGVKFFTTVLTMQLNRMDTPKRKEIVALSHNDLYGIVEDMNGTFWLLGYDNPLCATGGEGGTGTARTDGNKYGLAFTDSSDEPPYEVDASIISGIIDAL